jgi:hypothetical protein
LNFFALFLTAMNAPVFLLRFVRFFTAPLRAFASQFVGRYLSLQKLIHQTELFVPENRNVWWFKALTSMTEYEPRPPRTKQEREARKEQARWVAEQNMAEQRKVDEAFRSNFERLKAERKAREQLAERG